MSQGISVCMCISACLGDSNVKMPLVKTLMREAPYYCVCCASVKGACARDKWATEKGKAHQSKRCEREREKKDESDVFDGGFPLEACKGCDLTL